jgi:hypothetical protein
MKHTIGEHKIDWEEALKALENFVYDKERIFQPKMVAKTPKLNDLAYCEVLAKRNMIDAKFSYAHNESPTNYYGIALRSSIITEKDDIEVEHNKYIRRI